MESRLKHIYNEYLTSLLNRKYYRHQLAVCKRENTVFEILIALGASGSGIAGRGVWVTDDGKVVWACLAGLAALLAVIKPFIKSSSKIENYTKLFTAHGEIFLLN
jgi:hypothetical protein